MRTFAFVFLSVISFFSFARGDNVKLPFSFTTECRKYFDVNEVTRATNRYAWTDADCQFLPQGECVGFISAHSICGGIDDGVTVMKPQQAKDMPNGGVLFYSTYNKNPCDWGNGKSAHIAVVYQCYTPAKK